MLQKIIRQRVPFLRQYVDLSFMDGYKKMPRWLWNALTTNSPGDSITIYRQFGVDTDYIYSISVRPDEYLPVRHNSFFHKDFCDFLGELTGWREATQEEEEKL